MEFFEPGEVKKINEVRTLLRKIEKRNLREGTYRGGRMDAVLIQAEVSLFNILNIANVYCDAGLTVRELHNAK